MELLCNLLCKALTPPPFGRGPELMLTCNQLPCIRLR
jgi:hypothetical protein